MISLKRLKLLSLAVLVLGAGWLAVSEIRERGALASKQLAMAARAAIGRGEHDLAMLLALEGVPAGKGQLFHMDSLQARFALNEARQKNGLVGLFVDVGEVTGFGPFGPAKPFQQRRTSLDGKLRLVPRCEGEYRCVVDIVITETNAIRASIRGHSRMPEVATFSKTDEYIITASDVGREGDLSRRYYRYALEYEGKPGNSSSISEDGDMYPEYFLLSPDGESAYMVQQGSEALYVWDLGSDFPVTQAEFHASPIVGFFPRYGREELVLVDKSGLVSVWPLNADRLPMYQAKPIRKYQVNIGEVVSVKITSDDKILKLVSSNGNAALVNLGDGYPPLGLANWDDRGYIELEGFVTPDGHVAAKLASPNRLEVFDVEERLVLGSVTFDPKNRPEFFLAPNGQYLAELTHDSKKRGLRTLKIWQIEGIAVPGGSLKPIFEHRHQNEDTFYGEAIFDRSGKLWFFSDDRKETILLRWDPGANSVVNVQMPDTRYIPEMMEIGIVGDWGSKGDAESGREKPGYFSFATEELILFSQPVNPESGTVVTWSDLDEPVLARDGQVLHARAGDSSGSTREFFWSTRDGKFLGSFPVDTYEDVLVVSEAGRVVVAPENESEVIFVGDLASGSMERWNLSDFATGTEVHIGASGDYIVISKDGLTATIIDVERMAVIGRVPSLPSKATGFSVNMRKGYFAATSEDGELRVWSLASGDLLATLSGHGKGREDGHLVDGWWDHHFSGPWQLTPASPWYPEFLEGGHSILARSGAYGAEIWDFSHDDEMIFNTCASLPENRRSLTTEEYARYGITPRETGPCERHGPLSPDFWREKVENLGFL